MPTERYVFAKLISDRSLEVSETGWDSFIRNMPNGIVELCVHPGLLSDNPLDRPVFREQRYREYKILINPECKRICEKYGVELVNFNEF